MIFLRFIQKKFIRFLNSSKILKFFYFYHKIFNNKGLGNISFDFNNKKNRLQIVQEIIQKKNFKSYLEIGCFDDELFNHINCQFKIGVDPVSGGTIRMTSDQFFKDNNYSFDCIFIDGLHTYEQVRKDVYNSINYLNLDGTIFIHDCLPKSFLHQAVPRSRSIWNGDVWKIIVELRTKEDFDTCTCFIDQGVGIIKIRRNSNLNFKNVKNFKKLKFREYYFNYKKLMNVIEYRDIHTFLEI